MSNQFDENKFFNKCVYKDCENRRLSQIILENAYITFHQKQTWFMDT